MSTSEETKWILLSLSRIFFLYLIFWSMSSNLAAQISIEDIIYTQFDSKFDSIKNKIVESYDYNFKTKHKDFLEIYLGNKLNAKKITVWNSSMSKIEYTFLVNKLINVELTYKFSANSPENFESWYDKFTFYLDSFAKSNSSTGNLSKDTIKKMLSEDCVIMNKGDLNSSKGSRGERVWYLDSSTYHDTKKLTLNAYFIKEKLLENDNAECSYYLKFNLTNNRATDICRKYPDYSTIFYSSISKKVNKIQLTKINGVFCIPVVVDSAFKLDFIFDTGAADVSLTPDVVLTLIRAGLITEKDFIGDQTYQFADGTTAKSKLFILRSLKIGDKTIYNIKASLSESINAPLLLGQSAISKLGLFSIDLNSGFLKIEN